MFSLDRILSPHLQSRFPHEEGHYTPESKVFSPRQDQVLSCPQPPSSRPGVTMARQGGGFEGLSLMRESAEVTKNSKSQTVRVQCSAFRFQLLCFFFLTPETRHLKPPIKARNLYRQSHSTLTPAGRDLGLASRTRFSMFNKTMKNRCTMI